MFDNAALLNAEEKLRHFTDKTLEELLDYAFKQQGVIEQQEREIDYLYRTRDMKEAA